MISIIQTQQTLADFSRESGIPLILLKAANALDVHDIMEPGSAIRIPDTNNIPVKTIYTYEALAEATDSLVSSYPFITKHTIGHSVLGKELIELSIGTGTKKIHINAAFHGNEWITTAVLMYFIEEYAYRLSHADSKLLNAFEQTTVSFVPMVNPDGVDLVLLGRKAAESYQNLVFTLNEDQDDFSRWKANILGVDLNKQFPAGWELEAARKPINPHYRDYPGKGPLTELESLAMAELAKSRYFDMVLALHTQGEEIYWGFQGWEPPESAELAELFSNVSGYTAVQYVDNYAGFKDWFIQAFRKPGFTLELGHGNNPLPFSQFDEIYTKTSAILYAAICHESKN